MANDTERAREWRITQRHLTPLPVAGRTVFQIEADELDELLASYAAPLQEKIAELDRSLERWRDYMGCEVPEDSFIQTMRDKATAAAQIRANVAESKVAELEAALRPDEFLRQWYEQMKADDPHHFEEYDGEDFTTYGAYTFEEHFSQCAFITAFTKSIAALLAAPVAPAGQEKE